MLRTDQLVKSYDTAFKLGPINLAVAAGETVAVLGKNGAGKTTLFQILTGNLDATSGSVHLADQKLTPDTPLVKRQIGYLPQNPLLPRWVSGREILLYAAKLYELPHPHDHVAARELYWDCASYNDKPLATLSYGMQKRLSLALATLHDPPLVVLDEPFSGLDLFHIKALDDAIERRAAAGLATIVSTHDAANAAKLCHRALVVESGAVRALDGWQDGGFVQRIALIEQAFFGKGAS